MTSGVTLITFAVEVGAVDRQDRRAALTDLLVQDRRYTGSVDDEDDEAIDAVESAPEEIDQAVALGSIRAGDDARLLTFAGIPQNSRTVGSPRWSMLRCSTVSRKSTWRASGTAADRSP